jgi:hypothetical protein
VALWRVWAQLALGELSLGPQAILERLPAVDGGIAADIRWALSRLSAGETARIDCGGGDSEPVAGESWGRDRFFDGGEATNKRGIDIAGTQREAVYRTQRRFPQGYLQTSAYRVPVPRGAYEVTLHFAEVSWMSKGLRTFDILLEGKTVQPGYEPFVAGFRTAEKLRFEIPVTDGILDIELAPGKDWPSIAGIEIRRQGE